MNGAPSFLPSKRNLLLLGTGRLVSDLGSSVFAFALGLYIMDLTGSAQALTFILIAAVLPKVFLNLFAAVLVDRMNRKFLIVASDAVSAAAVLAFMLLFAAHPDRLFLFILYAMVLSGVNALYDLAVTASIPAVVETEHVPRANSMLQSVGAVVSILGPVLGAIAYATVGLKTIFLLDAVSFAVAAALGLFLRFKPRAAAAPQGAGSYAGQLGAVYRYLRAHPIVRDILVFACVIQAVFMPMFLLVLPYVTYNVLKVSGFQLSLMEAAWAIGAILASLVVSVLRDPDRVLRRFFLFIGLQAALFAAWALPALKLFEGVSLWVVTGLFLALLVTKGTLNTIQSILIFSHFQLKIPEHLSGRFFGLVSTAFLISVPVGLWVFGMILDPSNWPSVVLAASALMLLLALLAGRHRLFKAYFSRLGNPMPTMKLYAVDVRDVSDENYARLMDRLTPKEREETARFKFREDAVRKGVGILLLKHGLTGWYGLDEPLEFAKGPQGKPHLPAQPGIHFNLSHSGRWVILALDGSPVGVDVEGLAPVDPALARRYFSDREIAFLESISPEERDGAFYDLWTLKESFIKYIGKGLSAPLNSFSVLPNPDGTIAFDSEAPGEKPQFKQYPMDGAYRCAVCAQKGIFPEEMEKIPLDQLLNAFTPPPEPILSRRREIALYGTAALAVLLAVWAGMTGLRLPKPLPADAPQNVFSAERAVAQIRDLVIEPHPMGTPAHAQVAARLRKKLEALGLEVTEQTATVVAPQAPSVVLAGRVRNIMGRLKGSKPGNSLLLVAHYDSVPYGPGASDNGTAVAALLETARALSLGPPPERDVLFLFSDGEERDLMGARAFLAEHPWAGEVGIVLNFEARGIGGASILFESGPDSAALLRGWAREAGRPVAFSFSEEVYKVMPNDTDFTVFKDRGHRGLNFAFIEGGWAYHSSFDDLAHLSLSSLQHHGENALLLARRLSAAEAESSDRVPPLIYFPLGSFGWAEYPQALAGPLAIAAGVVWLGLCIYGIRKKTWGLKNLLFGLLFIFLAAFLAAILAHTLWTLFGFSQQGGLRITWNNACFTGLLLLSAAVGMAVLGSVVRRAGGMGLAAAGLLWWLILLIMTTVWAPGASYLFLWPLLAAELGLLIYIVLVSKRGSGAGSFPLIALLVAPVVFLAAPALYLIHQALGLDLVAPLAFLAVILLAPVLGALAAVCVRMRMKAAMALALLALAVGMGESVRLFFDGDYEREDSIFYALNTDTGKAIWASGDKVPDAWTAQFYKAKPIKGPIGEFLPGLSQRPYIHTPVSALALPAPGAAVVEERVAEGKRVLTLTLNSPRRATDLMLKIAPESPLLGVEIDGKPVQGDPPPSGAPWLMVFHAVPEEGIQVTLTLKPGKPLTFALADLSHGLPSIPGFEIKPRPPHITPAATGIRDGMVVKKTYSF